MHARSGCASLKIAVSLGALSPSLALLLVRQRSEEPGVSVQLNEVTLAEQLRGLEEGRYDGGLALTDAPEACLNAQPLWFDELAIALPARSPLLAYAEVPLEEAARYPVIRWCAHTCQPLSRLVDAVFVERNNQCLQPSRYAQTFDAMFVLVAAGYGIGLGPKARLSAARGMDIVTRPLTGSRHLLTTYFLRPETGPSGPVDRLFERARTVSV